MAAIFHSIIESPVGRLHLSTDDLRVTKVEWFRLPKTNLALASSPHSKLISKQFEQYFNRAHNDWDLSLTLCGTVFQQKVWQYLQTIPLGETRYYSDVARALNSSAQAVGNACRANPFVIVVPCHRVVSKSGLGGYDGQTSGHNLSIKQWLLDHERY